MPKRKAVTEPDSSKSPSKRVTRASAHSLANIEDDEPRRQTRSSAQGSPSKPDELGVLRSTSRPSVLRTPAVDKKETAPSSSPTKKPRGRPPAQTRSLPTKAAAHPPAGDASESDDSDELNLRTSPSKLKPQNIPPPTANTMRQTLDAVVISSPGSKKSMPSTPFRGKPLPRRSNPAITTPSSSSHVPPPSPPRTLRSHKSSPVRPQDQRSKSPVSPHEKRTATSRRQMAEAHGDAPEIPDTPTNLDDAAGPDNSSEAESLQAPPTSLPSDLPHRLRPCLRNQKRAILSSLCSTEGAVQDEAFANTTAYEQLSALLDGTISRDEGNSCLVLGPRGSGKTQLVEKALNTCSSKPIIVRLSGHVHYNGRLALHEIARQLQQQTGNAYPSDVNGGDETNEDDTALDSDIMIPVSSRLPALISTLPTLSRPTVLILDAFDLFTSHARQSLLYCLLDTAQSCRVGQGNKGIAVVGVTTRVNTIELLEKRVKSRFSGRIFHVQPPSGFKQWTNLARMWLNTSMRAPISPSDKEWSMMWPLAVSKFLDDRSVTEELGETYALTSDVRLLSQIIICVVSQLTPTSPFPTFTHLMSAISRQRTRVLFPFLHDLEYPAVCLIVAASHLHTAGHDSASFEMLYGEYQEQYKASASAPIQLQGSSIKITRCTREVLMAALEHLIEMRALVFVTPASAKVAPEFVRYKCLVERDDIKKAVDTKGHTDIKRWFSKS